MVFEWLSEFVQGNINSLPNNYRISINVLIYTFFIIIYTLFIWKIYRVISKRDIFSLNLKKYNRSEHPRTEKIFAIIFYILEYIVILPILVIFWFTILSLFLLLLSSSGVIEQNFEQLLFISAAMIISTRITSYLSEDLSKDFSRMFPFGVLAIFIIDNSFFNFDLLYKKIISIPTLFNEAGIFVVLIFILELASRITFSINQLFKTNEINSEDNIEIKNKKRKIIRI